MKTFSRSLLVAAFSLSSLFASAQFTVNGNAADISTKKQPTSFQLTSDAQGQKGTVWNKTKVNMRDNSFAVSFKGYFGTNDANGADGIALVFQNSAAGVNALGTGSMGQYMGFQGITPSLNVEFDTYNNGGTSGDIAADHISISRNGSTDAGNQLTTAVQASAASANVEDGQLHNILVEWDADNLVMSVYFDGSLRQTYTNNVVKTIFNGNGEVYWGFTASTGGSANTHAVYQVSFTTQAANFKTPGALPVSLISFVGTNTEKGNLVSWATATEKNSNYFSVERSPNAREWVAAGKVNSHQNSNTIQQYTFLDNSTAAVTYYRLKMVDLDGTFEYSAVVTVKGNAKTLSTLAAWPNPVQGNGELNLKFTSAANGLATVSVSDMLGNVVKTTKATATAGENNLNLSLENLKPGMYLVQVVNGNAKETAKILVK